MAKKTKEALKDLEMVTDKELKEFMVKREVREKQLDEAIAMVKLHSEIIEKYRVNFQNLDKVLRNLVERNRLR